MARTGNLFTLSGIIDIKENAATQKLKKVEKQSDKTAKSLKKNSGASSKASSGMQGLSSSLTSGISKFASIAVVIGVATKALGKYAMIQTEVAQLGTLFVGNTEKANKLADAAKRISKELGITQVEALSAAYKVASTQLGSTSEEMDKATESALKLARVGRAVGDSLDVKGVVNLLSTEIRAFGMNVDEIDSVSDRLFKTIQLGNTDINQLASALPQVSAVAHDAGVSFNELLAIIAGASKVIPDNIQITSSLTTAIAQLQNGAAGVGKKFEKTFGMRFVDAIKKTGSLTNVLVEFDKRLKKSGSSLAEAFGVRGLKGISAIVAVAGDINASLGKINDSSGLVTAGIAQLGEQGGLTFGQLKSQIEGALAGLGEGLAPILPMLVDLFKDLGQVIKPVAQILSKVLMPVTKMLSGVFNVLSNAIAEVFEVFAPLFDILEDFAPMFGDIAGLVMQISSGLFLIKPLLKGIKPIIQAIAYVLKGVAWVIKKIVWLAAKAIDLITKVATLGFGGTHYADKVDGWFKKDDDKADKFLKTGGATQGQLEAATSMGRSSAEQGRQSAASLGRTQSSGGTTVVQHNSFTQPQSSVEDIQRAIRQSARTAHSEID